MITGRHLHKTRDLADALKARDALIVVEPACETADSLAHTLAEKMTELIENDRLRKEIGERGQKLLLESQGAVDKAFAMIEDVLNSRLDGAEQQASLKEMAVRKT